MKSSPMLGWWWQIKFKSPDRGDVVRDLKWWERAVGNDAEPPLGLQECSRARPGGRGVRLCPLTTTMRATSPPGDRPPNLLPFPPTLLHTHTRVSAIGTCFPKGQRWCTNPHHIQAHIPFQKHSRIDDWRSASIGLTRQSLLHNKTEPKPQAMNSNEQYISQRDYTAYEFQ